MIITEAGSRVNCIDENSVFVGYDLAQICCEFVGYFYLTRMMKNSFMRKIQLLKKETKWYIFDTKIFKNVDVDFEIEEDKYVLD